MSLFVVRIQTEDIAVVPQDWRAVLARFPEEIREAWEERAAIIEYDGREPRPTAERRAFECVVGQFEEATIILSEWSAQAKAQTAPRRRLA